MDIINGRPHEEPTTIKTGDRRSTIALDTHETLVLALGANVVKVERTGEDGWTITCSNNITVKRDAANKLWYADEDLASLHNRSHSTR